MESRVYRVRLPAPLEAQLCELCELSQLSCSGVLRESLRYVLTHPDLWPEVLGQHGHLPTEDARTEAQRQAWARDFHKLTSPDSIQAILAQQRPPMAQ